MIIKLWKALFGDTNASKSVAKSRLHFVLVQDRTGLTNDEMAEFRSEMVKVIEKYFVVDKDGFDIKYQRDNDTTTLLINSPVIVRRVTSALTKAVETPVVKSKEIVATKIKESPKVKPPPTDTAPTNA